jgi:hypothetical protein
MGQAAAINENLSISSPFHTRLYLPHIEVVRGFSWRSSFKESALRSLLFWGIAIGYSVCCSRTVPLRVYACGDVETVV